MQLDIRKLHECTCSWSPLSCMNVPLSCTPTSLHLYIDMRACDHRCARTRLHSNYSHVPVGNGARYQGTCLQPRLMPVTRKRPPHPHPAPPPLLRFRPKSTDRSLLTTYCIQHLVLPRWAGDALLLGNRALTQERQETLSLGRLGASRHAVRAGSRAAGSAPRDVQSGRIASPPPFK